MLNNENCSCTVCQSCKDKIMEIKIYTHESDCRCHECCDSKRVAGKNSPAFNKGYILGLTMGIILTTFGVFILKATEVI